MVSCSPKDIIYEIAQKGSKLTLSCKNRQTKHYIMRVNYLKIYQIILLGVVLSSCNGFKEKQLLPGGHTLLYSSEDGFSSIAYILSEGSYIDVVTIDVFEYAYNEEFIIAKRHPHRFSLPVDESVTYYYIVPIKYRVSESPDLNKVGPLSKESFEKLKIEFSIPNSLVFKSVN